MARLPLPADKDLTDAQRDILSKIANSKRGGARGPFPALLRSPELCTRAASLGEFLRFETSLSPRLSEMAILITAQQWRSQFEWFAHASLARKGGLPEPVIEALRKGEQPRDMTPEESALYTFCTEIHRNKRVSDATYANAVKIFGEKGVVELIGISGYYALVSMVLNVSQVALPEGEALPFPEEV